MFLKLHELSVPLNFENIFGRNKPVEIEIGVGKGRFLIERAMAYPDHCFFGIEKSKKWLCHAAHRIEKAQLTNVRLFQCKAEDLVDHYVPDSSVSFYHILFPDPWPKKAHGKRRLFTFTFLYALLRTLKPSGEIHIATDFKNYYEEITHQLNTLSEVNLHYENMKPGPFFSNFQAKYVQEGRPLYFIRAYRRRNSNFNKKPCNVFNQEFNVSGPK